jgi:hypothetical protein
MASNAANRASHSEATAYGRKPMEAPPFEVIGCLFYDPITDTLT